MIRVFLKTYAPGICITLLFFIALLLTVTSYGVHEDNLLHFLRGQYFVERFSGKTQFEKPVDSRLSPIFFIPGQRISLYKPNPPEELTGLLRPFGRQIKELKRENERNSFYKHNAWADSVWGQSLDQGHPAVSDTLMAVSNRLFYEQLGILGDIESYYFYIIFVSSISIFLVYVFTKKVFGQTEAIIACITLALFPLFFAEAHFNPKDPVQMTFFTGSLISFYFFVTTKHSHAWFLAFVCFTFLALGTKWNIAFLPFIIIPWFLLVVKKEKARHALVIHKLLLYSILAVIIPFLLLVMAWPYLWDRTFEKLIDTFLFYTSLAQLDPRVDAPSPFPLPLGFNLSPLLRVVTTTPPVTLLFFVIGMVALLTRKVKGKYREEWLILLWLLIPLLRVSRQLADTAGSTRQFIEYLPAFAIIAGVGGGYLFQYVKRKMQSKKLPRILRFELLFYAFIFAFLAFNIVRLHPNQNLYFNFLAGGLSGAKESGLYSWKASYQNVYRQGAVWLNTHAPTNAKLAYMDGTMLAISPLWLRDDIYFGSYFSGFEQKGEYIISLAYPQPPSVFAYNYLERFLTPVYELRVDGIPVLKIWQNNKTYVKKNMQNFEQISEELEIKRGFFNKRKLWEISVPSSQKITRLILEIPPGCEDRKGVWSLIHQKKEKFMVPGIILGQEGTVEIDFPAEPADAIRFWDVQESSCMYDAKLNKIYVMKNN